MFLGNPLLSQILKKMFGVTDLSEHDSCINFLFLFLKFHLHRCKFQQTRPNFVAFLKSVKIKRNIEYKIAESKGKLRQHLRNGPLILKRPNIYIFVYLPYFDHITICTFLVWVENCVWFVWNVVYECCESFRLGASEYLYVFCPLFRVVFAIG